MFSLSHKYHGFSVCSGSCQINQAAREYWIAMDREDSRGSCRLEKRNTLISSGNHPFFDTTRSAALCMLTRGFDVE